MADAHGAIVVSGGSRGLGLAVVDRCLERGWPVASFARGATAAVRALAERHGERLLFDELDALDAEAVRDFVARADERFGGLYGLVNNAAIGQDHLLAHLAEERIAELIDLNLRAPILLTREVLKRMLLSEHGGRIVNVSSICGSRGFPGLSVYAATKGGLEAFTRSLAREVGERGILVNALAPGFFASEMSSVLSADQLAAIERRTATRRLTTVDDVLPALDLLLFEPTNLTGQVIAVDGGHGG